MKNELSLFLCAAVVVILAQGCAFNRTVINGQVRAMDPSFISPGKTTAREVINRLGPPPPMPEDSDRQKLFTDDYIRYSCYEIRSANLAIGYIVILPFWWKDTQAIDELLITLNPDGVVADVLRTRRETLWPLESESSRPPPLCTRPVGNKESR